MRINLSYFLCLVIILLFTHCDKQDRIKTQVDLAIETAMQKFAPDTRMAVLEVDPVIKNNRIVLRGKTSIPDAPAFIIEALKNSGFSITDSIKILPGDNLEGEVRAIVKISAANLRSKPSHAAELTTQATLGTPLQILERKGAWYRVQTPDQYIAWVDHGGIQTFKTSSFDSIQTLSKVIYLQTYGFAYSKPDHSSLRVSDLVAGSILTLSKELSAFYEVTYPDGRMAYVDQKETKPLVDWISELSSVPEDLLITARSMLGLPYLWGGTSSKALDCSGFTKNVYFLHGLIIPRDASQQARAGILVDSIGDFSKLQPGDLLFFGRKKGHQSQESIVHVGLWLGGDEFIHASGDVHISSLNPEKENFDEYNLNRYLKTKRILETDSDYLIDLRKTMVF